MLAITIELLAADRRGERRHAACYLAGVALPAVAQAAFGVFIAPSSLARGLVGEDRVVDVVDVVLGILLVVLGFWLVAPRPQATRSERPAASAGKLVWLGFPWCAPAGAPSHCSSPG